MSCLVVNLFGAPSAGKSTGAAYIFSKLKLMGYNAELVTEYAKEKCWENNTEILSGDNQIYVFGKQFHKMNRCKDKVDILITDSPLPLSILYNNSSVLGEEFNDVVMNCFNSFSNINYFVQRVKPYNPSGRLQTEAQSDALAKDLFKLLFDRGIEFKAIGGSENGYDDVVKDIVNIMNGRKE